MLISLQEWKNILKIIKNTLVYNELTDKPFCVKEIKKYINKLKIGKSAGPDLIGNEIIKFSRSITCKAITKLFNLILEQYPKQWRKSYTVLKSGDQSDLNNYRNISLQNCMTKLFSAVLNDRLIQHYEKIFSDSQFGFRANHRTTDSFFYSKIFDLKIFEEK